MLWGKQLTVFDALFLPWAFPVGSFPPLFYGGVHRWNWSALSTNCTTRIRYPCADPCILVTPVLILVASFLGRWSQFLAHLYHAVWKQQLQIDNSKSFPSNPLLSLPEGITIVTVQMNHRLATFVHSFDAPFVLLRKGWRIQYSGFSLKDILWYQLFTACFFKLWKRSCLTSADISWGKQVLRVPVREYCEAGQWHLGAGVWATSSRKSIWQLTWLLL